MARARPFCGVCQDEESSARSRVAPVLAQISESPSPDRASNLLLELTMQVLERLESEISHWPHTTSHQHRFGGREFLFGKAEVGHIHLGGVVDIPFTRPIHDALLAEGLVEKHR